MPNSTFLRAVTLTLLLGAPLHAQTNLPPEVQADLLIAKIESALKARTPYKARTHTEELRALGAALPVGQLELIEARVAMASDDFNAAQDILATFLATAERGSAPYNEAVELLSQLDTRRAERLTNLRTQAHVAELQGDFTLSKDLLTKLLSQTARDRAGYAELVAHLAGLETRRAEFAAKKRAEEKARDDRLRELENTFNITQNAKLAEQNTIDTMPGFADALLHLRFILNARYRENPSVLLRASKTLTDEERIFLAQYRKDKGLDRGHPDEALGFLDRELLEHAAQEPFAPIPVNFAAEQDAQSFDDWVVGNAIYTDTSERVCYTVTMAKDVGPKPEYLMPFVRLLFPEQQQGNGIGMEFNGVRAESKVIAQVDQRQFALDAGPEGYVKLPTDASLTRAMRRGSVLVLTGTSAVTGRSFTARFSLRGFTRAFTQAGRNCGRPSTLAWIQ